MSLSCATTAGDAARPAEVPADSVETADSSVDTGTTSGTDSATRDATTPVPRRELTDSAGPEMMMQDLTPVDGNALFLGVAMRLRNREKERDTAILHVAEQASRYVRLQAAYRFISQSDTGGIGYLDDVNAVWDAEYADSLVDSVEVLRESSDAVGTYILGYVPGLPSPPSLPSIGYTGSEEPRWIATPPSVSGYLTTVGVTTPSRRLRDSLDRADQEALVGLLQQTGTTVRMIEDRRERERTGTEMTVTTEQRADATLRGFYVLARYASPNGRYYYSLAIAREE